MLSIGNNPRTGQSEVAIATAKTHTDLETAFLGAMRKAEAAAGKLIGAMQGAAVAILDLHQAETWKTLVNEDGSQIYKSAKAYYSHIASAEKFPKVHKTVRTEIVGELFELGTTEDGKMLIGINELAALINTDPKQVSDTAKAEENRRKAEAEAAEAEAKATARAEAAEAAAAEAAAQAAAKAEAEGKTEAEAEAQAEAAAEAVRLYAAQAAEADAATAKAAALAASALASAAKAKAAVTKAKTGLENAFKVVSGLRADMSAEDAAWVLRLATEAVATWTAADLLAADPQAAAKAAATKAKAEAATAEAAQAAEATEAAIRAVLVGAPVDPAASAATPAEAAARAAAVTAKGRGRKAASA